MIESARVDGELGVLEQREMYRKWSAASRRRYDDAVDYRSVKSQLATALVLLKDNARNDRKRKNE